MNVFSRKTFWISFAKLYGGIGAFVGIFGALIWLAEVDPSWLERVRGIVKNAAILVVLFVGFPALAILPVFAALEAARGGGGREWPG